jgi:hypothetical protein
MQVRNPAGLGSRYEFAIEMHQQFAPPNPTRLDPLTQNLQKTIPCHGYCETTPRLRTLCYDDNNAFLTKETGGGVRFLELLHVTEKLRIFHALICPRVTRFVITVYFFASRSQCWSGLRHELFSPAPTLRSWVRIPLRHGCLCSVCVFSLSTVSSETASRPNKRLVRTYHWISLFMSYIKSSN